MTAGAWRLCGYSKEGCIVSNYKLEFWNPDAYGEDIDQAVDEYTRYIVYMVELMIGRMRPDEPTQQFVVIFDLKGFYMSMATRTNIRLMIRKLIYVAQSQYPERLRKVLLLNAPYGFETAWYMIKALLDVKTASKVVFCSSLSDLKPLRDEIDENVLPEEYGGTHAVYELPSKPLREEIADTDE